MDVFNLTLYSMTSIQNYIKQIPIVVDEDDDFEPISPLPLEQNASSTAFVKMEGYKKPITQRNHFTIRTTPTKK